MPYLTQLAARAHGNLTIAVDPPVRIRRGGAAHGAHAVRSRGRSRLSLAVALVSPREAGAAVVRGRSGSGPFP